MTLIRKLHSDAGRSGEDPPGPRLSAMDQPRSSPPSNRRLWWYGIGAVALLGAAVIIGRLQPAAPAVARDLLVTGTVRQGPMMRQVHGWGSFVPDRTQIVAAAEPGLVEAVYAIEGQEVRGGDRLIELANPEVALAVEKAEQKFAAARAGMIALSREQTARRLALQASIADTRIEFLAAEDEVEDMLARGPGQVREIEMRRAHERLDALAEMLAADEERLELITSSTEDQMAARRDELRWVESILESERARQRALTLRAGGDGVVERVLVQPGTRVVGGEPLAEITLTDRLKAVINVYAGEAEEIAPGQAVELEAAGGRVAGSVSSIDRVPGEKLATVTVALDENPPVQPDPDDEVEAWIRLGTLDDVTFVERPVYARANGWTTVFRIAEDSASAERVKVRLGRGSDDRIEILSGLEPGDRIVVSDISDFDDVDCFDIE